MPVEALQKFRQKYPGYDDLSDQELASKLVAKYPEYQDLLGDVAKAPAAAPRPPLDFFGAEGGPPIGMFGVPVVGYNEASRAGSKAALAGVARVVPPLLAGPAVVPATLAAVGGEAAAQGLEGEASPAGLGLAAALPAAGALAGRAARAVGRTITRAIPPVFDAAQARAQKAFGNVVEGFQPPPGAVGGAFEGARQTGGTVSMQPLTSMLDDLERTIRRTPGSAEQKSAKAYIGELRQELQAGQGTLSLDAMDALRRDLNSLWKETRGASWVRALQSGVTESLEQAAATAPQGGAAQLKEALTLFKRDRGATKLAELLETKGVVTDTVLGGKALNIAKLGRAVRDQREELTKLLGDDGMAVVDGFLDRFRSLPPTQVYTGWNTLVNGVLGVGSGVAGAVAGGSIAAPAAGAVVLTEMLRNMAGVRHNPAALNQIMNLVTLGSRAALQPDRPRNE